MDDYYFQLPQSLIALQPKFPRDHSRLMYINNEGECQHLLFNKLDSLLDPNTIMVFNNTKVLPCRLRAHRKTGAKVEILLTELPVSLSSNIIKVKIKPLSKLKLEEVIKINDSDILLKLIRIDYNLGQAELKIMSNISFTDLISKFGSMPLPPYIVNSRKLSGTEFDEKQDYKNYQTVYAKNAQSIAAPTAGLHFTENLLEILKNKNILQLFITLDVGLGTFEKLSQKNFEQGKLHQENFNITPKVAELIRKAKSEGKKILAVGTTTARALESAFSCNRINSGNQKTDLLIGPHFKFKVVDMLLTNFHLPSSSLSIMVHSFGGYDRVKKAYQKAIEMQYRFYSYGDAMLLHKFNQHQES